MMSEHEKSELIKGFGQAWSFSGDPPGRYIGTVTQAGRNFYIYKNGQEYFYDTDFDREMRESEKKKRRIWLEQHRGKTKYKG